MIGGVTCGVRHLHQGCVQTFIDQEFHNGPDFLALLGKEPLHPGIIIIVPNVTPVLQRELFQAALDHIGTRDLTNTVIEVKYVDSGRAYSEHAIRSPTE